ncbi:MAG: TolC family protein [Bdellovibrionales bacterium]|nr:TolC family protein [Bdellovibrionales bacterium]
MCLRRPFLIFLLATILADYSYGESLRASSVIDTPSQPLTLSKVLKSVKVHHPTIQQELKKRQEAEAQQLSANGAYDPVIRSKSFSYLNGFYSGSSTESIAEVPVDLAYGSLFARYRKGSGTLPVYEDEFQTLDGGEVGVGVKFSLLRNLLDDERKLGIDLARYERELAELSIDVSRVALQQAATERYWTWIAQGQILKIYRKLLEVAETRQAQLVARVEAGDLAAFEALDNQRSILQRRSRVVKQEALVKELALGLSLYFRGSAGTPIVPSLEELPSNVPKIAEPQKSLERYLLEAYQQRPDLKRIETEVRMIQREERFESSRLLPDLELSTSYSRDDGSGSLSREGDEVKFYVSVEVPLFQRKTKGKLRKLENATHRKLIGKRYLQEKIRTDLSVYLTQLQQAYDRYLVSVAELETTKELEDGESERFKSGDSNLLFLAMRELAAAEARVHVIEANAENLLYYHLLEISTGSNQHY